MPTPPAAAEPGARQRSSAAATLRHALCVVGAYAVVLGWLYARPVLDGRFLAESDLYEYYLPIFLSPFTIWSSFEFSGLPAFADPGDFTLYPLHLLLARVVGPSAFSWTALSVSAFVLGATFAYAYARTWTRSRAGAALAGLAYGLSEAMMERLPHSGTLHAAVWLPLLLLAVDRLTADTWRRWLAIGSAAVACCLLAGHPQPAIYVYYCAGAYALAGGWLERRPAVFYARVAATFTLGALLTLVKMLPFVEASFLMARQEVNFGQFASHANSPAQMLSMVFPSIVHEGREAPTYVGLITLGLAMAGVLHGWRRDWRVVFFVAVAVFALLMGMGDSTPLAGLAYHLPLYGKFRAAARHLFLAACALSLLAGYAVAAFERGAASRRTALLAACALAAAVVAGAATLAVAPQAFTFETRAALPWALPIWNSGVWVQMGLCALAVVIVVLAPRGRIVLVTAAAAALLLADTAYSLPYPVGRAGLTPITIPAAATQPSVHAERLARAVAPLHQRLLAPGGTHRDAVVPAAWARVWRIPIAGGYGPMLLQQQSLLSQMGTNGAVPFSVLATHDVALDLLAVRRIVMKAEDLVPPAQFERHGLTWAEPLLDVTAGRADCNQAHPRALSLALPPDVEIAEVALVGHLRCGEDLQTATAVARVQLRDDTATVFESTLHAGVEIADRALADPAVAARAHHGPAAIFDDPEAEPYEYLVRLRPPTPVRATRLVIDVPAMPAWVAIDRLTLVDRTGRQVPLSSPGVWLADRERWIEGEQFDTDRTSDRSSDQAVPGETRYVVFENQHARPRAWLVDAVHALDEASQVAAVRHAQLPDGRPFDPRTMALVDTTAPGGTRRYSSGPSTVAVETIADSRITVRVDSRGGGFLVLSEAFYPGWRALVDDAPVAVERTNLALQGVAVPPGAHVVSFTFAPSSLRVGAGASIAGLLIMGWLLVARGRAATTPPAGPRA